MDSFAFRFRLGRVFVLAVALFLLVSNGWANCYRYQTSQPGCNTSCDAGFPDCSKCHPAYVDQCTSIASRVSCSTYPYMASGSLACTSTGSVVYVYYCCSTECEAEQKRCEDDGGTWVPSDDPNECGECQEQSSSSSAESSSSSEQCEVQPCPGDGNYWDSDSCKCLNNCEAMKAECQMQGGIVVDTVGAYCDFRCEKSECDTAALASAKKTCREEGGDPSELSQGEYPECEILGECKYCETRYCCDSLEKNRQTETDTSWLGCVQVTNDHRCIVNEVSVDDIDTSASANCSGFGKFAVCTRTWVFASGKDENGRQCKQVPTNNCIEFTREDDRCRNVMCRSRQKSMINTLDYNQSDKCYHGTVTQETIITCDNGIQEQVKSETRSFTICDDYLDQNHLTLNQYLNGPNNSQYVPNMNTSGPNDPSDPNWPEVTDPNNNSLPNNNTGVCVGNNCPSNPYDGGPTVTASGDTIMNSPSPNLNGYEENVEQIVYEIDSTGQVTIVRNSDGGDSTVLAPISYSLECSTPINGVSVCRSGNSTFSCSGVQSAFQAELKARLGDCEGSVSQSSGNTNRPTVSWGDSVTTVVGGDGIESKDYSAAINNLSRTATWFYNYFSFPATYASFADAVNDVVTSVVASSQNQIEYQDSIYNRERENLWKQVFGENLDLVREQNLIIMSASSTNSQAINSATSQMASATSQASLDVVNALSQLKSAVNAASSTNSQAINSATSQMTTAMGQVVSAVNSASSNVGNKIDGFKSSYIDSVHNTNSVLRSIYSTLDTSGRIPNHIDDAANKVAGAVSSLPASFDSSFKVSLDSWYNDKLKISIDSNAIRIAQAIDSLNLEVSLDSISLEVPHDSILDSIFLNQKRPTSEWNMTYSQDSLDLGSVMKSAFDSSFGDTSFVLDSSFALQMEAQAANTIDGSDVSDTEVDSLETTLSARLDSSQARMNIRSDSVTSAYKDTLMKYYGVDSIGHAMNDFFGGYASGCPKNCLDITLNGGVMTVGQDVKIELSYYLCEMTLIGNITVLDFIKLILRIYTAYLCMCMLLQAIPLGRNGGRK